LGDGKPLKARATVSDGAHRHSHALSRCAESQTDQGPDGTTTPDPRPPVTEVSLRFCP
jgi:hypothetical protein